MSISYTYKPLRFYKEVFHALNSKQTILTEQYVEKFNKQLKHLDLPTRRILYR